MSDLQGLGLTAVLLLANAFFVGAEFALISARRTKIEPRAEEGNPVAKMTLFAMEHVSLMMAGAQLGITVCSLALGSISEPAIAHLLEAPMDDLGIPAGWQHPIALVIALSLVTYLHVVFGEMVPKNIALAGPDRMAMVLSPILLAFCTLLYPVLWLLNGIANISLRIIRVTPKDEVTSAFTRDEVAGLVAEAHEGGLLELNDERLLLGALQFAERDIRSVLLPIEQVRTLPEGVTPAQAEAASAQGYSRFPVASSNGTLTGYIHIKDIIGIDPSHRDEPVPGAAVRPLPQVAPTASLREVMASMQRMSSHLAVVQEPASPIGTIPLGVVTLEDVLEELVGEIRDDSRRLATQR
ncbi:hemolysin family protein [Serinibacter salmoneus]|uniref:CBS domain containing-hemolysin-like protein n=1 Tax=Serinibacter salmoneus TaxID=556530 RepID=A0A2A9D2G6_9MICO|nr:hemolysin family protein [Serinibacter salmoneus]PFG20050.1 CBS domain containing-hemolysin-like protein [Serinibacter salmoneus]